MRDELNKQGGDPSMEIFDFPEEVNNIIQFYASKKIQKHGLKQQHAALAEFLTRLTKGENGQANSVHYQVREAIAKAVKESLQEEEE